MASKTHLLFLFDFHHGPTVWNFTTRLKGLSTKIQLLHPQDSLGSPSFLHPFLLLPVPPPSFLPFLSSPSCSSSLPPSFNCCLHSKPVSPVPAPPPSSLWRLPFFLRMIVLSLTSQTSPHQLTHAKCFYDPWASMHYVQSRTVQWQG